jgi:hypothetical protein
VAAAPGEFPAPASTAKDSLDKCPQDYYPVSGLCCPKYAPSVTPLRCICEANSISSGYYKFTKKFAYQIPCFSYLPETTTPPPITVGLAAIPTNTAVPTSAIVNLVWAMSFNLTAEQPQTLSKGAVVGIGVGSGIAAIVIVAAVAYLFLRWRRKKKTAREEQLGGPGDTQQGMTYQSGYHAPQDRVMEEPHGGMGDVHQGLTYYSGYHAPQGSPPPPMAMRPTYGGTGGAWDPGYAYRSQSMGYEGYSRT